MTLAGILAICALLTSGVQAPQPQPTPAQQDPSQAAQQPTPEQSKPAGQEQQQETKPGQPATPQPAPAQAPPEQPGTSQTSPATTTGNQAPPPSTQSKKKQRRHKRVAKPSDAPTRTVVREGGTSESIVQLSPRMTEEQASHQRQRTSQLLASTDANLKRISERQLKPNEQEMLSQVRNYIEQARAAVAAGDLRRGRNLALKAHLLSDELVRH